MHDAVGRFTLDVADVPAIPDEQYMPPIDAFLYQVLFYYKSARSSADFWVEKAKKWSKGVDHFAEPTKAIKEAVAGIVKPGDSDLDKAQKLYQAVEALDNTDYTRTKGKAELKALGFKPAKRAEDTWAQKSGSSQDITLLYLAMLRAAGLTAWDMKVVDRNRNLFQIGYLYFGQLDDDLVILSTGGKDYVLDPGEKMCPFQTVSWIHSAASGVRQSPGSGLVAATVGEAPAVILYDEYLITVDAQNRAVERERYAVRILKPQGREYAHCTEYYNEDRKLRAFHVWTIAADGKQFESKDENFSDRGDTNDPVMQSTDRYRVVNPPGADPGAVVSCETEVQLEPYIHEEEWILQGGLPVVREAMELALPSGGHYAEAWRGMTAVKPTEGDGNHLRWEIHNEPGLDLERVRATPPELALAARASVKWGDLAVKGTENQWQALGVWEGGLQTHRYDPTPEITAKAQELTAGVPDFYTKLERITDYIQKNIRYFIVMKGIGGMQAHYAADIYRNKYGDCKDKTTLLISMLAAVGVKAHYFHVHSERGVIAPEIPSLIGDHMITAIELPVGETDKKLESRVKTADGRELLIFDPTDEWTPVGLIREDLQGGYGLLADAEKSEVLRMPVLPAETSGVVREGQFTLAADGGLSGELSERRTGDDAMYVRGLLKGSDAKEVKEWLERRLGGDLPGIAFQDYGFAREAELNKPLALTMKLTATNYSHMAGQLLLVRPRIAGSHVYLVPDVMEGRLRLYPIVLGHPGVWRDSFDVALPAGYKVDDAPEPVNLDVGFASYKSSVTTKGSALHYESEYVVHNVEIPPSKAGDFRKLEQAIVASEKSAAVLKKE